MRASYRNRARIVVVLLFIFMVINFADKAVIGIAAVPIMALEFRVRSRGMRRWHRPLLRPCVRG